MVANYQRESKMSINRNGEDAPNYYPNSSDGIYTDETSEEPAMLLDSTIAGWYDRSAEGENVHHIIRNPEC